MACMGSTSEVPAIFADRQRLAPTFRDLLIRLAEEHEVVVSCAVRALRRENKLLTAELQRIRKLTACSESEEALRIGEVESAEVLERITPPPSSSSFQRIPTPPPSKRLSSGMVGDRRSSSVDSCLPASTSQAPASQNRLSRHDPRGYSPRASICGSDLREVLPKSEPMRRTTWSYSPSTKCLTERASFEWCQRTGRRLQCEELPAHEAQEENIELLAVWQGKGRVTFGALPSPRPSRSESFLRRTLRHLETGSLVEEPGPSICLERTASKYVTQPGSTAHLAWNALGILLIGHDLIMIPLQAFRPRSSIFTLMVSWAATIFWTLDIPASFLVGFHADGVIEMDLRKIAAHYARTWLALDLLVVAVDWCLACAGAVSTSMTQENSFEYNRVWRLLRFMALLRLLRLFKVQGALSDITERVRSEFCLIIFGILKLILLIMLASHLIACGWYGIGTLGNEGSDQTWLQVYGLLEADLLYQYTTSLHWSLTQFTPASMEVFPQNAGERVFAVCVLLFAMVTFSSFISSITNAMTQLRNLNRERHEQLSVLRRYLVENRVSGPTMVRIWGCLQKTMDKSMTCLHEQDVSILQLLPWSLKSDLQEEIYAPIIGNHPLFLQYGQLYPQQMQRIYQRALEELSLGIGKQLFNIGEVADRMFFVRSGMLNYSQEEYTQPPSPVSSGQWVCEAVLWVKWKHTGQLLSAMNCELIAVKAVKLQDILQQSKEAVRYARQFATYFRKYPKILSDIYADQEVLQTMVQKAFSEDGDQEAGRMKANLAAVPEGRGSLLSIQSRRMSLSSLLFGFQGFAHRWSKGSKDSDCSQQSVDVCNNRASRFTGPGLLSRMPTWKRHRQSNPDFDEASNESADSDTDSSSDTTHNDTESSASVQSTPRRQASEHTRRVNSAERPSSNRSPPGHKRPMSTEFDSSFSARSGSSVESEASTKSGGPPPLPEIAVRLNNFRSSSNSCSPLKKISDRRSTGFEFGECSDVTGSCPEASTFHFQSVTTVDADFLPNLLVGSSSTDASSCPSEAAADERTAHELAMKRDSKASQAGRLRGAWG